MSSMSSSSNINRNFPLNYLGSKYKLFSPFIDKYLNRILDENDHRFGDLMAGTGIVGYLVSRTRKMRVVFNDLMRYSYYLTKSCITKLSAAEKTQIQDLIAQYNQLPPNPDGFIAQNFSNGGKSDRMFFTPENAGKIDSIRQAINALPDGNVRDYLLACLISAADKVSNVSCTFEAYLKQFKSSAVKSLELKYIEMGDDFIEGESHCGDVTSVTQYLDVVYLDPPYNSRQYSSVYHLLETIACYDDPEISGVAGKRDCSEQKSKFSQVSAPEEFERVVSGVKCGKLLVSYNNEGIIPIDEMKRIMRKYGRLKVYTRPYKKFKAQQSVKGQSTVEYLFYLRKRFNINFAD